MEELAAKSSVPIVPEASIGNQKTSERKVYELAYLDNRWQLQTEPESDHERLWFDYALETNRHSSSD